MRIWQIKVRSAVGLFWLVAFKKALFCVYCLLLPSSNFTIMHTVLRRVQLKCDGTRWRTGGEVKGKYRMDLVASTLHTTSEYDVSSVITADAHTSAASSRLNWRPCRFKWTRRFRRKTKSVFCACAITFQTQSTLPATPFQKLHSILWSHFMRVRLKT